MLKKAHFPVRNYAQFELEIFIFKPVPKALEVSYDTRFSFYKNTVYKNISLRFGKKIRTF